ncbi:MAG TPA: methyltransferase domain-containing protein [Kofleriaceae bacterium]
MSERGVHGENYVLGTDQAELDRLGSQHAVWRDAALDAWSRAGIKVGHTVLDVGCGPGFASADLAQVVGPSGHVLAIDKAPHYLATTTARGFSQITARACDLDAEDLPLGGVHVDAAWARWVFCFLRNPRGLVEKLARAVAPGGVFVAHEYFDYASWRGQPAMPENDEFVAAVMASWRANGGEPNIAFPLVRWLDELGFDIVATVPHVFAAAPGEPHFAWVKHFAHTGPQRLVELGFLATDRPSAVAAAYARQEATPAARIVTPSLLEIVARRRG